MRLRLRGGCDRGDDRQKDGTEAPEAGRWFPPRAMSMSLPPQPVAVALRALIACAEALPAGDAERHVQTSAHELAAACVRRADVRAAVDRLAEAVTQLQRVLLSGARRRQQHDALAVERLLETLQEQLLPELRANGLL